MGDLPGFAQEQKIYPDALTKDDLYVEIATDNWVGLNYESLERVLLQALTIQQSSTRGCKPFQ
jgi:hypothetical protein